MEDMKNNELLKVIDVVSPYQRVIRYFMIGFIFASVHINYLLLPHIHALISALCFYFGLRMIKNENKAFLWAYYFSVLILVFAFVDITLYVTPFQIPSLIIYIFMIMKIFEVLLICLGLHTLIKDKTYAIWLGICYVMMNIVYLFSHKLMFGGIILFILLFIFIIYHFINCKDYLLNYYDQTHLSYVKYPASLISVLYIVLVIVSMTITNATYPHFLYQHVDAELIEYQYPILDEKSYQNLNVKLYDYDNERYLTVYRYQLNDVHLKTMKFKINHSVSRHGYYPYEIVDIIMSDHKNSYEIREVKQTDLDQSLDFMTIHLDQNIYEVYLNPDVHSYVLQFGILMNKKTDDEFIGLREDVIYVDLAYYTIFPSALKNRYQETIQMRCMMSDDKIEVID